MLSRVVSRTLPSKSRSSVTRTSVRRMSLFDTTVKDANGNDYPLSQHKGKVVLVFNAASHCGYTTKNYKAIQEAYDKYREKGFEVLAFPCNQFGAQEPEACPIIQKNMNEKFGVTFPILDKVDVNGENTSPVFSLAKSKFPGDIKWNFEKFLFDKDGNLVQRYKSAWSSVINEEIEKLL